MQREAVMTPDSCLVLYGNSVFLAGIKAELESRVTLELVTIEAGCPDVMEQIRTRRPRAVLFDLSMAQPDFAIQLLREQLSLLLIGVDPSSNEMLVLSSHSAQALNMQDLLQVIEAGIHPVRAERAGPPSQGDAHLHCAARSAAQVSQGRDGLPKEDNLKELSDHPSNHETTQLSNYPTNKEQK